MLSNGNRTRWSSGRHSASRPWCSGVPCKVLSSDTRCGSVFAEKMAAVGAHTSTTKSPSLVRHVAVSVTDIYSELATLPWL